MLTYFVHLQCDPLKSYLVKYRDAMRGDQVDLMKNKEMLVTEGELDSPVFQVAAIDTGDPNTITLQAVGLCFTFEFFYQAWMNIFLHFDDFLERNNKHILFSMF